MCQWKFLVLRYSANTSARMPFSAAAISRAADAPRSVGVASGAWRRRRVLLAFFAVDAFMASPKEVSTGNYHPCKARGIRSSATPPGQERLLQVQIALDSMKYAVTDVPTVTHLNQTLALGVQRRQSHQAIRACAAPVQIGFHFLVIGDGRLAIGIRRRDRARTYLVRV